LLGAQSEIQNSWDQNASGRFPDASASNLEASYSKSGRLRIKMSGFGKKLYDLFTRDRKTGKQKLNPALPKENRTSLGPMAQERIDQGNEIDRQRTKFVQQQKV